MIRVNPAAPAARFPMRRKQGAYSAPTFGGVTGLLQDRHWVSGDTLRQLLGVSSTPYIGSLPAALISLAPESPKRVYQALDELAPLLRGMEHVDDVGFTFNIDNAERPVSLRKVGNGVFGTVYELAGGGRSYALKVYHENIPVPNSLWGTHGAFGESATGLYFSRKRLRNLARFHCGNPKTGWTISEFITPDMRSAFRPGKSVEGYGAQLDDPYGSGGNSINGIRVDYGGIGKAEPIIPLSPALNGINVFRQAIASGDVVLQAAAARKISALAEGVRKEAFLLAMETGDPSVQVAAVSNIHSLLGDFKPTAFRMARKTNRHDVQAAALTQLHVLPEEAGQEAFLQAMQTGSPIVQASAAAMIYTLPDEFIEEAVMQAVRTGSPMVHAGVASNAASIPVDIATEILRQARQTGDHAEKTAAVLVIPALLPKELRQEAFLLAMQSGDPALQALAASRISYLPEWFRREAVDLYLQAMQDVFRQVKDLKVTVMAPGSRNNKPKGSR